MFGVAWLGTLWGKVTLYGVIAILALMLWRWHSNKVYNDGFQKGKQQGVADTIDQHKKDWDAQQKDLDSLRQQMVKDKEQLNAEKAAVLQNRAVIVSTLAKGQQVLGQKIDDLKPFVANVPASEIDSEIRKQLESLR